MQFGTGNPQNDAGLPVLKNMNNQFNPCSNWDQLLKLIHILKKGDKEMKLKTTLFISLKIIALTLILFICWSVAGGVMGL